MDCTFPTDQGTFNYRVGAIILDENRLLMVHGRRRDQSYTVGGRVHLHETSEEAMLREIYEETGVKAEIDRLGFIHEHFFKVKGTSYHEFSLIFYVKPFDYSLIDPEKIKCDGDTEELCRLDLNRLPQGELYPEFFRTELLNPSNEIKHIITREY